MIDELIKPVIQENIELIQVQVIRNKEISFILAKERDNIDKKNYLRSFLILIGDELVTTNYADTVVLLAEIQKFERTGRKEKNFYTEVRQDNGQLGLQLALTNGHIYITPAEALAISIMHTKSMKGLSENRIIEDELILTAEMIATYLHKNKMLNKKEVKCNI